MSRLFELAPKPDTLRAHEKYNVFLSYRSVNRPWVIALHDALVSIGHKVFLDQFVLVPGRDLSESLDDALTSSVSGVLIWSRAASDSEWVAKEYKTMLERSKLEQNFSFVPVRLDKTSLPDNVDERLFADFGSYPDGPNGGELLRLMHGIVGIPLSDEAVRYAEDLDEAAQDASSEIEAAKQKGDIDWLVSLIDQGGEAWEGSPQLASEAAEALIRLKAYPEALNVLEPLEERFKRALRPKQLLAHVLTRTQVPNNTARASRILHKLSAKGHRDPETMGLLGKVYYEDYIASGGDWTTRDGMLLRRSRNSYREGFEFSAGDTYCGINAAAKTLMLREPTSEDEAAATAKLVLDRLPVSVFVEMDYYEAATIAEARLILRHNSGDVAQSYQRAIDKAPTERGAHDSTYRQLLHLCDIMGQTQAERAVLSKPFAHLGKV